MGTVRHLQGSAGKGTELSVKSYPSACLCTASHFASLGEIAESVEHATLHCDNSLVPGCSQLAWVRRGNPFLPWY
jgi:hypothetical protein